MAQNDVTQEELDKFEMFLFEMDDVLEEFVAEALKEGYELDYSLASLDRLEDLLLAEVPERADPWPLKNRAARYLGEVFRKTVGGKWELCIDDPRNIYYKMPVISGYATMPLEFCPMQLVGTFVRGKRSGLFKTAVEGDLEFKA